MIGEVDVEVAADLQLREQSTRDRSRSRVSLEAIGRWTPGEDKIVGAWKCREHHRGCRNLVDVTEDTMARWAMFNRQLRARGETGLETDSMLRCTTCSDEIKRRRADLLRKRVGEMAECIRQLKASTNHREERELIKQLEAWRHPDLPGLLGVLDARKTRKSRGEV